MISHNQLSCRRRAARAVLMAIAWILGVPMLVGLTATAAGAQSAVTQSPTPVADVKPFQMIGTIDPASIAIRIICPDGTEGTRMSGSLRGADIGRGTYTLCLDLPIAPHQLWSAGTLTFIDEDGVSRFTLRVSASRTSSLATTATYLGTYDLDPDSPLGGTFAGRFSGGSGLFELSRRSQLLLLNGVVKSDSVR
jgi:hypothetical protein